MLKEHKATAHGLDGSYTCEYCDFKSSGVSEMEGHMVKHMEGIKSCQHCDFTSTEVAYMKKHMEKHNEPNALTCTESNNSADGSAPRIALKESSIVVTTFIIRACTSSF